LTHENTPLHSTGYAVDVLYSAPSTLGHFGDESFQSITCTGTDKLTT